MISLCALSTFVISGLKSSHASLSQRTRLFVSVSISVQEELPHLIMHCFTNFIFRLSLEVMRNNCARFLRFSKVSERFSRFEQQRGLRAFFCQRRKCKTLSLAKVLSIILLRTIFHLFISSGLLQCPCRYKTAPSPSHVARFYHPLSPWTKICPEYTHAQKYVSAKYAQWICASYQEFIWKKILFSFMSCSCLYVNLPKSYRVNTKSSIHPILFLREGFVPKRPVQKKCNM